jgi:hypothetical protein
MCFSLLPFICHALALVIRTIMHKHLRCLSLTSPCCGSHCGTIRRTKAGTQPRASQHNAAAASQQQQHDCNDGTDVTAAAAAAAAAIDNGASSSSSSGWSDSDGEGFERPKRKGRQLAQQAAASLQSKGQQVSRDVCCKECIKLILEGTCKQLKQPNTPLHTQLVTLLMRTSWMQPRVTLHHLL